MYMLFYYQHLQTKQIKSDYHKLHFVQPKIVSFPCGLLLDIINIHVIHILHWRDVTPCDTMSI